ncbi:MAG: Cof-type HAD-IIB family hydrolase [Butyrivibrio sp.]|nr:Cof-type HAD-IIB family hydrolase [Butyrivibrio sp.]
MKQKIRMIGLDLDGTLLTEDKTLSARTRTVLSRAIANGITIVPVTGRPLAGLPPVVRSFPGIRYSIHSNGAAVYDLTARRCLHGELLHPSVAGRILSLVDDPGAICEVFTEGYGYADPFGRSLLEKRYQGTVLMPYIQQSRRVVPSLEKFLQHVSTGIENVSVIGTSQKYCQELVQRLMTIEGIRVVVPSPSNLEVGAARSDKGLALLSLAEYLGIPRASVMAMGDSDNDVGLLKNAGLSVAMGNASPHVREISMHVTDDNEHDGVAKAIEEFAL